MASTLDLEHRDPHNINGHVAVGFDDVLAEPDGQHSHDCLWKCSYSCFNCAKKTCYYLLTFLCGWYLAFCWGCEFACLSFSHIWMYTPCLRICQINLGLAQKFFGTCVSCCLAPVCETCGLIFSKVGVEHRGGSFVQEQKNAI